MRDVKSALLRSDAFVYAIAIDPPDALPINTRVNPYALREITDDSGGRTEVVHDSSDLEAATSDVQMARPRNGLPSRRLCAIATLISSDAALDSEPSVPTVPTRIPRISTRKFGNSAVPSVSASGTAKKSPATSQSARIAST